LSLFSIVVLPLLTATQGVPPAGWDLHHMWNGPSGPARVFIFYAIIVVLVATGVLLKFWWRFGLRDTKTSGCLSDVASAIEKEDRAAVQATLNKLSPRSPEALLAKRFQVSPANVTTLAFSVPASVDSEFRLTLEEVRSKSRSLITMVLVGWLIFTWAFGSDVHVILDEVLEQRISADRWFPAWMHETYGFVSLAVWLGLFNFLVYWHIRKRLDWRRAQWEHFCARINQSSHGHS